MSLINKVLIFLLALILAACGKTEANDNSVSVGGSEKATQMEPAISPRLSREPVLNAAPLGLEIGYANLAGIKQKLGSMTNLTDAGKSDHTGGVILASDGQGLGVDGLSKFLAIFDKNETLVAVVMTLPKNVNATYSKLAQKYTPISKNIDAFMGNGNAKFEKGDSLVMIEAPHLSFVMEVSYATKTFMATVERNTAEAQAKKEQEQKDKL